MAVGIRTYFILTFTLIVACSQTDKDLIEESENSGKMFETDPELKDFIPANSSQIELVNNANDRYKIEYAYACGECIGFCERSYKISSEGILESKHRWSDHKDYISYISVDIAIYESIIASIDFQEFANFDENIGCGDCADACSEHLFISEGDEIAKVHGTSGFSCEPVEELLKFCRDL